MFDQTNQTGEAMESGIELPENLFGDDAEDVSDATETTSAEGAEDTATEGAASTEPEDAQGKPAAQTVKVKYNGKEQEIALDEAVKLAQKGMNYDHVSSELETLRKGYDVIDAYAKASGVTRDEYLEFLRQNQAEYTRQQVRQELKTKDDIPDELVDEIAQGRVARQELEQVRQKEQQQTQTQEAQVQAWMALRERFPDAEIDKLPPEVYEAVQGGMTPLEAYLDHQMRETQSKLAVYEKDKDTKKRAIGALADEGAPGEERDPFLQGFHSV